MEWKGSAMKTSKMQTRDRRVEADRPGASRAVFDFEVGTLVQSPCRMCPMRAMLPGCSADCALLAQIQALLADTISSGQGVVSADFYRLALDNGQDVT